MDATYLKTKHEAAVPYAQYVRSGTAAQGDNWKAIYDQAVLTDKQRLLVGGFTRKMPVIAVSGIWCGDCVQQGPLLATSFHPELTSDTRLHRRFLDLTSWAPSGQKA